jgi:hypothetical protein
MSEFKNYVSNTFVGTSNNYILKWDKEKTITGRMYFKVCEHGEFDYKFLFSNTVDSTFADGSVSVANMLGGKWTILSAFAGDGGEKISEFDQAILSPVLFSQNIEKDVLPGELFWSDEIKLSISKGHYLVFQWTIVGNNMPYTPDKIVPSFIKENDNFIECVDFPQPHLVACNRKVNKRISFFGDSITQGLATRNDYYEFWVAEIGKKLGNEFSVWNLGLGYGRAQDAASDGVWLSKAKEMDLVSVCFGVNDILKGRTKEQICDDLLHIVLELKNSGCGVGIFTIPPFDWEGENEKTWRFVNQYILDELSEYTDYLFDTVKVLGELPPNDNKAKYGGHPDGNGGMALSNSFIESVHIK